MNKGLMVVIFIACVLALIAVATVAGVDFETRDYFEIHKVD